MGDTALKKAHTKLSHEPIYLARRISFATRFNDLPSNFNSIPTNDEHKPLVTAGLWAADKWIVALRCRPPLLFGQHVTLQITLLIDGVAFASMQRAAVQRGCILTGKAGGDVRHGDQWWRGRSARRTQSSACSLPAPHAGGEAPEDVARLIEAHGLRRFSGLERR